MTEKVVIGNAELYCGDCLEILPTLPKVDAVITDPPYGVGFSHSGNDRSGIGAGKYSTKFSGVAICNDDKEFNPAPFLGLGSFVCLWGANHYASKLPNMSSWFVWDKRAASMHSNDFADCEMAWVNTGKVARVFRHHWDGMMKQSERGVSRVHPTQKPIALMEWCLSHANNPSVVFYPFMGSGTTGVACMNLGCKFIGIEIESKYFDIACRRIEDAQRQERMFA
jgi:site-specific DNA-methyltransferase (adenine-specific)/modification methylase